MVHQDEKPIASDHVELARNRTIESLPTKSQMVLPQAIKHKVDAAEEILQGERVEMTDEQVRTALFVSKIIRLIPPTNRAATSAARLTE